MIHPASVERRFNNPLWAITTYFNPCGYRRRLENIIRFAADSRCRWSRWNCHSTVFCALEPADADILVQLSGGDVMWQKERLLNIALQSIPDDGKPVAWLDCDVVFETNDWAERTRRALDDFALLHLMKSAIICLPTDCRLSLTPSMPSCRYSPWSTNWLLEKRVRKTSSMPALCCHPYGPPLDSRGRVAGMYSKSMASMMRALSAVPIERC